MELHTYQYHYHILLSTFHTLHKNLMKKDILLDENHIQHIYPYLIPHIFSCAQQVLVTFVKNTILIYTTNTYKIKRSVFFTIVV